MNDSDVIKKIEGRFLDPVWKTHARSCSWWSYANDDCQCIEIRKSALIDAAEAKLDAEKEG